MENKQSEHDFEHIGDSQTVEKRSDITTKDTSTDEQHVTQIESLPPSTAVPLAAPQKKTSNFNKYFLYTLVAGLVVSALISITAVLIGEFNSTMGRALGTTGSMVAHTLVALLLLSNGTKHNKGNSLVLNTLLLITIASFITSLLGIWDLISGRIVGDLYLVYFYTFGAVLWVQLLLEVGNNLVDKATRITSQISIGLTALFYVLIVPTAFINYPDKIAEIHLRAIAASAIALATASVLSTVFHRIHVFKHPEVKSLPSTKSGWDIVMAVIVLFFGLPIIFMLIASLASFHSSDTYNTSSSSSETSTALKSSPDPTLPPITDCSQEPGFETPKTLQYASTYIYESNDPRMHELSVDSSDTYTPLSAITYTGTLRAVDTACKFLDITQDLRAGDTIRVYLKEGYTNFYNGAVVFIQKVE